MNDNTRYFRGRNTINGVELPVIVKGADIFGNDTMTIVDESVGGKK
ncbi:MAG: hypothetical protein ACOYOS_22385 [Syntrophales bacterium]